MRFANPPVEAHRHFSEAFQTWDFHKESILEIVSSPSHTWRLWESQDFMILVILTPDRGTGHHSKALPRYTFLTTAPVLWVRGLGKQKRRVMWAKGRGHRHHLGGTHARSERQYLLQCQTTLNCHLFLRAWHENPLFLFFVIIFLTFVRKGFELNFKMIYS